MGGTNVGEGATGEAEESWTVKENDRRRTRSRREREIACREKRGRTCREGKAKRAEGKESVESEE